MTKTIPSRDLPYTVEEGHPQRGQILAILCLSLVLVVVAVSSVNIAIPSIVKALNPTSSELLWIIDSYGLVFAGLLLTAGAIGDRFGRKGTLVGGLIVFGLASLGATFARNPTELIVTRGVMGVGAAFVMPATLSIITAVFPPKERAKAIATWAGLAGAGGALGPILSGLVLSRWDWNVVFFVNIPIVLVSLFLVTLRVPTSKAAAFHRLDLVGAGLSIVALVALVFGIIEGPAKGWTSPLVLGAFAVGAIFLLAFILFELKTESPMLDPRFFKIPGFRAGAIVVTTLFFTMFGMFFILTQYLQFARGYSPLVAGLAGLPFAVMMVVVTPRAPLLVQKFGVRPTIIGGTLSVAIGFFIYSQITTTSSYAVVLFALIFLGAGIGIATAPASTAIVSSLPLDKAGVASAMNDTTREVGGAFGIAIMGTMLNNLYRNNVSDALPPGVPEEASTALESSIGAAPQVAEKAPAGLGDQVLSIANESFTSAAASTYFAAACMLVVAAVGLYFIIPKDMPSGADH